jgi:hypothetical protein
MAEPIDIDSLFALPLDEFTSARNALAKRLAAKGEKDQAAEVKALRKPSVTAWAVNRLAHDYAREVGQLLKATEDVSGSRDASTLRRTTAARTKVLSDLVEAARSILDEAGRTASGGQLEKITQTLQTASTSDEHKDDLVKGRLQADLEPSGFGEVVAFAPQEAGRGVGSAATQTSGAESQTIDHRARAAKKKAEELAKKAAAAEERAAKLESRAEQLEEMAAEARAAADKATAEAGRARARSEEAAQPR